MGLIDDLPGELLETVFTHSSWAPDRASSYERLEFLGDVVINLAISESLYAAYPNDDEGLLSTRRASIVSTTGLSRLAARLTAMAAIAVQWPSRG